jgi:hypothetical protein
LSDFIWFSVDSCCLQVVDAACGKLRVGYALWP